MERIMQGIMVDTTIQLDQQILLTHDGCLVTPSSNPKNNATTVNFLYGKNMCLICIPRMVVAIVTHFICLLILK